MTTRLHQPVLLQEVLTALSIKPAGCYLDATFGRGGHSQAILAQLNADGHLIVLDRDPEAIAYAKQLFSDDSRVAVFQSAFGNLANLAKSHGWAHQFDGILLDLGVSSPQLDTPIRGFSFMQEGPLDMRMNPEEGISVATWLQQVSEKELVDVLFTYGEERFARRIARRLLEHQKEHPIQTTRELAELVASAVPTREKGKHPATRTFQALRICINQELQELESVLRAIPEVLAPGGRAAIISFHSLEDRLVKNFLRQSEEGPKLPKEIPLMHLEFTPPLRRVSKAIRPSEEECRENPRARSAVLRVAEKPG